MSASPSVHYRVRIDDPHAHLFAVEATFPAAEKEFPLHMAVWTPGSYLIREYPKHLQDAEAVDLEGNPLTLRREDKRTFVVEAKGKAFCLRYRIYANEMTVRTSHLDDSHAYWNGATLFVFADAYRKVPHSVTVEPPNGHQVFAALPSVHNTFSAEDLDELLDSPFEVGPHNPIQFKAHGVDHQLVAWGLDTPFSPELVKDMEAIIDAEAKMFGGLPHKGYTFFLHCTDKGRGGLEHKASSSLLFPRQQLQGRISERAREDFLSLVAHEYFHLWNVKRIIPKRLVPFDYTQEVHTTLLWAFEGVTSYYDMLFLRRSGCMPEARYLSRVGESLSALASTPGRKVQSLAESSWLTWIKQYRPDENSPNSSISYYLKGEIVALLLDLEIRRATEDQKSLDDVMRLLWERHGNGQGIEEDAVEGAAQEVVGETVSLKGFFDKAIRSTEELDTSVFSHVGLELKWRIKESATDKGGTPARNPEKHRGGWLGLSLKADKSVAVVLSDSPAMKAGVYSGDEIIAVDGYRAEGSTLFSRCDDLDAGDRVTLSLFRRDKLHQVELTLGEKPQNAAYLVPVEAPSEAQLKAKKAWLGLE